MCLRGVEYPPQINDSTICTFQLGYMSGVKETYLIFGKWTYNIQSYIAHHIVEMKHLIKSSWLTNRKVYAKELP